MTSAPFEISAFESLGDNCEFGFLQQRRGYSDSGLLRWAVTSPDSLLMLLTENFAGFYDYDQLVPSAENMVEDKRYGIYLHSKMKSTKVNGVLQYIQCEEDRRATWVDERARFERLVAKLLNQLNTAAKIFVYKRNAGLNDHVAAAIARQLNAYNPDNILLLAGLHEGVSPGSVWLSGPGLICAAIDKFAPYDRADTGSDEYWESICRRAFALIAGLRPERRLSAAWPSSGNY